MSAPHAGAVCLTGGRDGTTDGAVSREQQLARLISDIGPCNSGQVLEAARQRWPAMTQARLLRIVASALGAGLIQDDNGILRAADAPATPIPSGHRSAVTAQVPRAVVVDVEAVVRPTADHPDGDRRIYQIGAVRLSSERRWVDEAPRFTAWVRLPDVDWEEQLRSASVRDQYAARAIPVEQALHDLREYLAAANVLVAYNGTGADFPMLDDAATRAEQPPFGALRRADALYLAHAVWPTARSHRLAELADEVGVGRSGLSWHDAADDADLTARLLRHAADTVSGWDGPLRDLLLAAGAGSPAWDLLTSLLSAPSGRPAADDGSVAQVLADVLGSGDLREPTRRGRAVPENLTVPERLFDRTGHVDPHALALVAAHGSVERRPAQQHMAELLARQVDAGRDALCEAPTGTGKSLAVLATALGWLASNSRRRVVLATFTKQLQTQLAADITRLAMVVPGLDDVADLVKGTRNRLSLRALVAALTDAVAAAAGASHRDRRNRFAAHPGYRELLVYLVQRLATATSAQQAWVARSVDTADIPIFLAEYISTTAGPLMALWLASVSQESDDYGPGSASPLAHMTDTVGEALANHRLVVANHALLLSNPDAFADDTLLVVDEAHSLEHAATGAASAEVDYRAVENLVAELRRWFASQRGAPAALGEQIADLEAMLDTEVMPRAAQAVFDAAGGEPGNRAATLASPFGGLGGSASARQLLARVERLAVVAGLVYRQLSGHLGSEQMQAASWWERERAASLASRVCSLAEAADQIATDAHAILDPPRPDAGNAAGQPGTPADQPAGSGGDDAPGVDDDESGETEAPVDPLEERLGEVGADDAGPDLMPDDSGSAPVVSNWVVFATELELEGLSVSARRYAFTVTSAPIELAHDPQWRLARSRFDRIFYVSATLQVSGRWDYIRSRLGLGSDVDAHYLPGPFDLASQARLVCLTDFPSWAEQADGAVRTVAHHLTGYAREVIRPETAGDDGSAATGVFTGGALVLTTSTRAASAISERLLAELPAVAPDVPVAVAPILGNARAARAFTETGGFCVATRGMWQGVDFPAERLSLVWINKLPFAPFADPVVAARRAAVARRAADTGHPDPDRVATESYYLPLAAMDLRQAVGRLIRSAHHRGVVIISDRKLAGQTALRRSYRRVFLESLDPGLLVADPDTGEAAGGNLTTMADGWERIWRFLADCGKITAARADELCTADALAEHTLLPATRKILAARIDGDTETTARAEGKLGDLLVERCSQIAGYLRFSDVPLQLRDQQEQVIRAVADKADVLALLPTGFGKSYTFQLPALALTGVTVVVSPLVALMADQALELNASVGGAVRALVGPMAESNSRRGKTEVAEQLTGVHDHGIKLVYISPERLGNRRFQQLLRTGAANGQLRRVAVDEAHTFVQWGDDFRPSFRRAAGLLTELRDRHGVRVTAVTATANRGVRAGLRSGLFGLPETPSAGEPLVTVTADPLRPELAIYRRTFRAAGPNVVAGLAEAVTSACDDHAIFYCLTVREVDTLYAHLREFVGEGETRRVRRFHGRLSEAEKAAVLTEFRDAPKNGEEGYVPLLIVATSAFGLGVNRGDIRCVFVVSPPTDLAGLYQQLGRAGRDQAGCDPAEITAPSYGLALGTGRGFRNVAWMISQGLANPTLQRIGNAVVAAARGSGVLNPDHVADIVIGEEIDAGWMSLDDARKPATMTMYRTAVIRALAALDAAGTVDDCGDFPATVTLTPLDDPIRCDDTLADAAAVVQQLAATRPGRHQLTDVHQQLAAAVTGYDGLADDVAGTWALLATLHDLGVVDVSQAGNTQTLVSVRMLDRTGRLPADFATRMNAHRARLNTELTALRDWYAEQAQCANVGFADYFGQPGQSVPDGTCSTAACRCSTCWSSSADTTPTPVLLNALNTPRPRPAADRDGAPYQAAVDRYLRALLWDNFHGLTAGMLHRVLRGDEAYRDSRSGRLRPLWPQLLYHRLRGVDPGMKLTHVTDALARLEAAGEAALTDGGRVWRLRRHVDRDNARAAARQAGAAR
ncbi:DEAD/DEAH box helicase [Micromonospora sp. S4605]|nr:DEAD/DEAH box helicase [Micromonospora sp. S4605]